ncbi:MAG: YkgJ family cysteine cluster protein [Methanobacteriota archaeon]|nr:MAG: YkgJ family cysteine cluster protein [Euryarchaeota archaeon]
MSGDGSCNRIVEVDLSELTGRTYRCIDGCALCCLCQPELLPREEEAFRKDPKLSAGVTQSHISPEVKGAAIDLKGSHGACHFLTDRRCSIYDARPHFCRSFPLNVFVGWRIQVNVNLSCKGVGLRGEDLEARGRRLVEEYGQERLSDEVRTSKAVFDEFMRNARDALVAQPFSSARQAAALLREELTDLVGLSRVMTYAEYGRTRQDSPPVDIVRRVRETEAEADVAERAMMDGIELFDLPELSLLPVHVGEELTWSIFRLVGSNIVGYHLAEDGGLSETSRTEPSSVDLLPVEPEGLSRFGEYLELVNRRDCFAGHAAYLCSIEGYEYNLAQVYLGAIANNMVDLWWRSSLLAGLKGSESIGSREAGEGIAFFDMDLLDLPTIGAFM